MSIFPNHIPNSSKYCPLLFSTSFVRLDDTSCVTDNCAWWSEEGQCCAILWSPNINFSTSRVVEETETDLLTKGKYYKALLKEHQKIYGVLQKVHRKTSDAISINRANNKDIFLLLGQLAEAIKYIADIQFQIISDELDNRE